MKKIGALIALLCALLLSGCGSSGYVSYAPVAYGANGDCYYVNSPAEVVALEAAGLCPTNWVPVLMPYYWHNQYYAFYSSPAYYGHYVPVASRTTYVTQQHNYYTTNQTTIVKAESTAKYKGSNGKVVSGNKVVAKVSKASTAPKVSLVKPTTKTKTSTGGSVSRPKSNSGGGGSITRHSTSGGSTRRK